jgi:hypothetical protein
MAWTGSTLPLFFQASSKMFPLVTEVQTQLFELCSSDKSKSGSEAFQQTFCYSCQLAARVALWRQYKTMTIQTEGKFIGSEP